LLLLDEPGNHLDLPTLLWLESFLQTWQGSFVVVVDLLLFRFVAQSIACILLLQRLTGGAAG
jgi:ATPase subunit of ABC transporter with duplicated ATPase domains